MIFPVVLEIRLARRSIKELSRHDRRLLICRIVDSLKGVFEDPGFARRLSDPSGVERVIVSTENAISQIAVADDADFLAIIGEFETLLAKLSATMLRPSPARPPRLLH